MSYKLKTTNPSLQTRGIYVLWATYGDIASHPFSTNLSADRQEFRTYGAVRCRGKSFFNGKISGYAKVFIIRQIILFA